MIKAVLVSVGGSISPVIYSLNKQKPTYIIFFVSKDSEKQVKEIEQKLNFKYQFTEKIVTPSAEIMDEAFITIKEKLHSILARWKIKPHQLVVDYTGGTKSMSVALVLATIDFCKKYSYIGGKERTSDGLGVVIDGKEKQSYVLNPWDKYALLLKERVNFLFSQCDFDYALNILEDLKEKVSEEEKYYYLMWIKIIKGYLLWDRFRHKEALDNLKHGFHEFKLYSHGKKDYEKCLKKIKSNLAFLESLDDDKLILDLVANAKRRGDIEGKFDDAVARLYRALEKFAQNELKKLSINPSNVKEEQIPENIRSEFVEKYKDRKSGKIKIPLEASYRLLQEKGSESGIKFFQEYDKIRSILDIRNNSILAHGDVPVKKETYQSLLRLVIDFCGISEARLPAFPQIKI